MAKFISSIPSRKYQGYSFITPSGKKGCVPFTKLYTFVYCDECYAKDFCEIKKEPKLILENGELRRLRNGN